MKKKLSLDLPAEEQYAAIEEIIAEFAHELFWIQKTEISRTSRFKDDLDFDSFDFIRLVVTIEEKTGIHIEDSDIFDQNNKVNFSEYTVDTLIKACIKNIKS